MQQEPYFNFPYFNFPFSKVNIQRCENPDGFNMPNIDNFYLLAAMTEELGELAGAIKKLKRGFNPRELNKMKLKWQKAQKLGTIGDPSTVEMPTDADFEKLWYHTKQRDLEAEAADLITYFDMFLTRNGVDIKRAVKNKFNQVSDEMQCPQYKIQ